MGLGDSSKPAADAQAAAAFGQGLWQIPGEQSNFAISIDTRDVETYIPPTRSSPFLGQQDKGKQGAAAALKAARASAYASDSGYAPSSASHHKRRLSDSEPVVYTHGQGHGGSPYDAGMRFVRFAGMTPHKRRSSTAAFMDYIKRHLPEDARPHRTPLTLTVKRGFLMFCIVFSATYLAMALLPFTTFSGSTARDPASLLIHRGPGYYGNSRIFQGGSNLRDPHVDGDERDHRLEYDRARNVRGDALVGDGPGTRERQDVGVQPKPFRSPTLAQEAVIDQESPKVAADAAPAPATRPPTEPVFRMVDDDGYVAELPTAEDTEIRVRPEGVRRKIENGQARLDRLKKAPALRSSTPEEGDARRKPIMPFDKLKEKIAAGQRRGEAQRAETVEKSRELPGEDAVAREAIAVSAVEADGGHLQVDPEPEALAEESVPKRPIIRNDRNEKEKKEDKQVKGVGLAADREDGPPHELGSQAKPVPGEDRPSDRQGKAALRNMAAIRRKGSSFDEAPPKKKVGAKMHAPEDDLIPERYVGKDGKGPRERTGQGAKLSPENDLE